MLQVHDLTAGYGPLTVLSDISLSLPDGARLGIFGHNGAGKTTLLRCIVGAVRPRAGTVELDGVDTGGASVAANVRRGIAFVPQGHNVFPNLSVQQNLGIAGLLFDPAFVTQVYELFPVLAERRQQRAGSMSGGEQQMLTIARTLMGNPSLVLLDEPSEGLSPKIVEQMVDAILTMKKEGVSILLSEQNLHFARLISDRAYIIERGRICFAGTMSELDARPDIRDAHLAL